MILLRLDEVLTLIGAASGTECVLCPKNEAQARKCTLRKTLDAITTHNIPRVDGCSYRAFTIDDDRKVEWPCPPGK